MAPKKSVLLLITLSLALGLATAQQSSNEITVSQEEVWLNSNSDKVYFQVNYHENCEPGTEKATVSLPGDNSNQVNYDNLDDNEDVQTVEGDNLDYNFTFSDLDSTGTYTIDATCKDSTSTEDKKINADTNGEFKADELEISDLNLNYENSEETAYVGENVQGSVSLSSEGEVLVEEFSKEDLNFTLADVSFDGSSVENNVKTFDFSFEALENIEKEDFEVSVDGFEPSVSTSTDLSIQDVWQVDQKVDEKVKYRNFQDLSVSFQITKRGEAYNGFEDDDFEFAGGSGNNFFDLEKNNGEYTVSFDSTPKIDNRAPTEETFELTALPREQDFGESPFEVGEVEIEKDIEFSGEIRDLERSRVPTTFTAEFDNRDTTFTNGDSAAFEEFFSDAEAPIFEMDFPEAKFELKNFEFVREYPDGQEKDIRYNYYDAFENLEFEGEAAEIRPVNLVSVESDYDFESDPDESRVNLNFDSSQVEDTRDVVVYECDYWMFERESCANEWEEKDVRTLGQETLNVQVNPYGEQFGGTANVLWNAYLIGVPQGVGSSLTLQENSVDGLPGRIKSGEEFSLSGKVIDTTTGDPVEDANVSIEIVPESNDDSITPKDQKTDSNGDFEYTDTIDDAGSYTSRITVNKHPYESFSFKGQEKMEVYYEKGLSIESDSNPEIGLGEDYNIEYDIENVGQASVDDIELSVSGVDNGETSLNPTSISSLEPGSSQTVVLTVNLDEDLRTPPSITFEAEGASADETVTQSSSTLVSLADDATTSNQEDSQETQESQQDSQKNDSSNSIPNPSEIQQVTGEFIESQSQMNLALGLILVFAAILAVAVKNKDSDSRERRGRGQGRGQSRVQAPQVTPQEEEEPESETSEASEKEESTGDQSSEESSDEESDSFKCDVCGETFDTESGMNLHKQALH